MNLRYFNLKYFHSALVLLAFGFFAISLLNCLKTFHDGVLFVEQDSVKPVALGLNDCNPDEAKNGDVEGGEGGCNPLFCFPFPAQVTTSKIKSNSLLIPRLHINIRHSRAPPAHFYS